VRSHFPRRPASVQTFSYLAEQLNKVGIVYLHVFDSIADGAKPLLRRKFDRAYIVNGGFDLGGRYQIRSSVP
jgi:N-ethylmaleimide reductase